ncbi:MAG: hypothetical protein GY857_21330 [Desulfobacula sp.]|nr:hypothetical protein [Desulfobacula sp.]
MRIRWIGPAIAPLVILSFFGLKNIFLIVKTRCIKYLSLILIVFIMSMNAAYIYQLFNKIDPLSYIFHKVTRDEYIEKFRPGYAALQLTNQLKGDIKLLAFFLGNRMYYSDHDIKFKHDLFKIMVQHSKTPDDIYQALKIKDFTNLIINFSQFNPWVDRTFTLDEKKQIQLFFSNHTKKIFSKNGHGVYQCIP